MTGELAVGGRSTDADTRTSGASSLCNHSSRPPATYRFARSAMIELMIETIPASRPPHRRFDDSATTSQSRAWGNLTGLPEDPAARACSLPWQPESTVGFGKHGRGVERPRLRRFQTRARYARMSVCGRPSGCKRFFERLLRRVQVLPCVRPTDAAIITAAGLYGDRGSGPHRFCALVALGHSLVFPTPSSDRCAIPLF